MKTQEIVGYKNIKRGFIFCSQCFSEYLLMQYIPEDIKDEFTPIHFNEKWAIYPSCVECNKQIIH